MLSILSSVKKLDLENDPHDVWYSNIINEDVDYMINVDTDEADNMWLGVFVNTRIRDYDGDCSNCKRVRRN